jgi:predicted lipoprotein with Yx(FWY)xxD motif
METRAPSARGWLHIILRGVGAGLLIATASIHLDLYVTGYRTIPTIGWLFLLQVIVAFALGLAVLVIPSRLVIASRLAAAAGAGFALSTLGCYLLTVWIGLFGFKEVRTTAGIVAGVLEILAFAVLAALALAPAPRERGAETPAAEGRAVSAGFPDEIPTPIARTAGLTASVLFVAAVVLLGVAVGNAAGSAPAVASTDTVLKTTTIHGATVLTNSKGFTLYSFAPDTPTTSKCYGSCAAYWPPVIGTAAAGAGLPGKTTTIKRTDGSLQLTYNGHPLYTYIGDTAPGQASGNNVNLNGGLWLEVPAAPAGETSDDPGGGHGPFEIIDLRV